MIHRGKINLPPMPDPMHLEILLEEACAMEARGNGLAAVAAFERALEIDNRLHRWRFEEKYWRYAVAYGVAPKAALINLQVVT